MLSDVYAEISKDFYRFWARQAEGKIMMILDPKEGDGSRWRLVVVCNLEGKWVLHWGVTYCDELKR